MAAADDDDDDDDDDSDGESEEAEEAPDGVGATMKERVEDCMKKLAIEAQVFMCAVDKLLISNDVEERKASLLTDALKDRLCKRLTEEGVNQAAINDILATDVISPFLEFIRDTLPKVPNEALSERPQPRNEAAETAVGQQLLNAFKDDLLCAGKAALLKRLSPIVRKWVRASRVRVAPAGKSALT